MKITDVELIRLDLPLIVPYTIAYETVSKTTNFILKITSDSGLIGWGCSAPDMPVTGESPEDVIAATDRVIIGLLSGQEVFQIARYNHELKKKSVGPSAMAMVDIALHDLLARCAGIPLYRLLGGFRSRILTSITIGILPLAETLEHAGDYLKQGFSVIKLKGGTSLDEDVEKVLKLREKFGKEFKLRFDANQGYSSQDAIRFIDCTREADIEIFEQPTNRRFEEELGQVTQNVKVPVMADESIKSLKDAFRLASNDLIDMVNIKIMKVGGLVEALHINSVAKSAGMEAMVGCLDECALGIAAGLHFALSRPNIEFADLDGHLDLLDDPFKGLFDLRNGMLFPTDAPGLGLISL